MFEDYKAPVDETKLPKITDMAEEICQLSNLIAEQEEVLKNLKSRFNQLSKIDLPEIMKAANLSEFALANGKKVEVSDFISASIPKDQIKKKQLFDWLSENDASAIIKSEVSIPFEKSQHNMAISLAEDLKEKGHNAEINENVHHKTFLAFLRERLSVGESLPDEKLINLFHGKVAKVK